MKQINKFPSLSVSFLLSWHCDVSSIFFHGQSITPSSPLAIHSPSFPLPAGKNTYRKKMSFDNYLFDQFFNRFFSRDGWMLLLFLLSYMLFTFLFQRFLLTLLVTMRENNAAYAPPPSPPPPPLPPRLRKNGGGGSGGGDVTTSTMTPPEKKRK